MTEAVDAPSRERGHARTLGGWQRPLGWAGVVGLLAAGAWSLLALATRADNVPTEPEWRAAAAVVAADVQATDAIAFAPAWIDDHRWLFAPAWSDKKLAFEAAWLPNSVLTPWELVGFRRLWRVVATGVPHDVAPAPGRLLRSVAIGARLRVELIEAPDQREVYDLGRDLAQAEVVRAGPAADAVERCVAQGERQVCPGEWWRSVFWGLHEAGGERRHCTYATPHPDGATLRIRWPKPPAGGAIEGRFGHRLWAVRHDQGSDVEVGLEIGDTQRFSASVARGDFGWHRLHVPLAAGERGQPIALTLRAADHRWRQFCFDLRILGVAAGSAVAALPGSAAPAAAAGAVTPTAVGPSGRP